MSVKVHEFKRKLMTRYIEILETQDSQIGVHEAVRTIIQVIYDIVEIVDCQKEEYYESDALIIHEIQE